MQWTISPEWSSCIPQNNILWRGHRPPPSFQGNTFSCNFPCSCPSATRWNGYQYTASSSISRYCQYRQWDILTTFPTTWLLCCIIYSWSTQLQLAYVAGNARAQLVASMVHSNVHVILSHWNKWYVLFHVQLLTILYMEMRDSSISYCVVCGDGNSKFPTLVPEGLQLQLIGFGGFRRGIQTSLPWPRHGYNLAMQPSTPCVHQAIDLSESQEKRVEEA